MELLCHHKLHMSPLKLLECLMSPLKLLHCLMSPLKLLGCLMSPLKLLAGRTADKPAAPEGSQC